MFIQTQNNPVDDLIGSYVVLTKGVIQMIQVLLCIKLTVLIKFVFVLFDTGNNNADFQKVSTGISSVPEKLGNRKIKSNFHYCTSCYICKWIMCSRNAITRRKVHKIIVCSEEIRSSTVRRIQWIQSWNLQGEGCMKLWTNLQIQIFRSQGLHRHLCRYMIELNGLGVYYLVYM